MSKSKQLLVENRADDGFLTRLREAVGAAGGPAVVAKSAGIAQSTLSDYLAGTEVRFGRVVAIAKACKVSLNWLGFGDQLLDLDYKIPLLTSENLNTPMNFYLFIVSLQACREFFEKKPRPTLAEVLTWVAGPYALHASINDFRIKIVNEEEA